MNTEWPRLKDTVKASIIIAGYLGPAKKSRGGKLYWLCPFHDDHSPSFVVDQRTNRWNCYPCGKSGDAAEFLKLHLGIKFPEAVDILVGDQPAVKHERVVPRSVQALKQVKPPLTIAKDATPDKEMTEWQAREIADEAATRIMSDDGDPDMVYLEDRGLTSKTIIAARLGSVNRAKGVPWKPDGISIPWIAWGRVVALKIRASNTWLNRFQGDDKPPRYISAYKASDAVVYPSPVIKPFLPLVVVEGELDALLLGQELDGMATVITTGCAADVPGPGLLAALGVAGRWYAAHDADEAGDKAAAHWRKKAKRVRPPSGKDWGETAASGINLREYWKIVLGRDQPEE